MRIDKKFMPMAKVFSDFRAECKKAGGRPFAVCVERNDGYRCTYRLEILNGEENNERNFRIIERLVKTLLWVYGGYKVITGGCGYIGARLKETYCIGGEREFDAKFMARIYEKPFETVSVKYGEVPDSYEVVEKHKISLDGCRIGFDAGGSDRKVSAVIDGETVYSEETVWLPKVNGDPKYHFDGIMESMKAAAAHMPRVDAIGVSSAGVYVNNRAMAASLFMSVPDDLFEKHIKNIYIDVAKEFGNVPLVVANDGDVTALAGAMSLSSNKVLGIAMGTSEAAGYVDGNGCIRGWLNELAFAPVDFNRDTITDPWSGDIGCGVNYFSQDAVIKLADIAGIDLSAYPTPAEKLKAVQKLAQSGDDAACDIFHDIGSYLAHGLAYYANFYDMENVLVLGRVSSGKGGEIMINRCKKLFASEYPDLAAKVKIHLPDEKSRRVGQSIAAASMPEIKK